MTTTLQRPHLFGVLAGLCLAAGLCFASVVFTSTWLRINETQMIHVTGSSRRDVRSDLVVWNAVLQVESKTLAEAYANFRTDSEKLQAFLAARGHTKFELSPVQVRDLTKRKNDDLIVDEVPERTGFLLLQGLQLSSADVEGIPKLAAECLTLMADGVVVQTGSIQFIYTKAGETKVQMMAEATADARNRANEIATRGGRTIRELRTARVGVVQINPLYSTTTSAEGNNDQGSLEKTITVTVSADFGLK